MLFRSEILYVFGKEEEWLLVQSQKEGGRAGYIPGNYVEEVSPQHLKHISTKLIDLQTTAAGASHEASASSSPPVHDVTAIVIPDSVRLVYPIAVTFNTNTTA